MNGTRLAGLEGTNPLGFFAALGIQVAFKTQSERPRLWWSDEITPRAIVDDDFTIEVIADKALAAFSEWKSSPAIEPHGFKKGAEAKFSATELRAYLEQSHGSGAGGEFAAALVAEGSLDSTKELKSKPTDLYFTAGRQKFLEMVCKVLGGAKRADLIEGLEGPWAYRSPLPSLMWDVSDDRDYALSAKDPSEKKFTNPGPEALAILGMSLHPVFAGRDRTLTQGCSGKWKSGTYSWPLWRKPSSLNAVRSLLAHAYFTEEKPWQKDWKSRRDRFPAWGVAQILKSAIRRSDEGGYGTFGPAEVVWRAD